MGMRSIEDREDTAFSDLALHLDVDFSVACREVFAHGDMHSMHDL